MSRAKVQIPREKLEYFYLDKNLAPLKIAKLFNCNRMTISNRLKEFNIPVKSASIARMRYKKYDFSGDLAEKAYLIGFRLGDLNVYKKTKGSELIVARCNTTQLSQINLMKKLFSKYGKVTLSEGVYSTNVNCYLNNSFRFLLPKYVNVPVWIKKSEAVGYAFISGYSDAEGNFLINQGRARFKIDSYDFLVLRWISSWLKTQRIRVKFRQIAKRRDFRSNGTRFKNDLWRLNVNEAISLLKFIKNTYALSLHQGRKNDMKICEKNIEQRINNKSVRTP